VTQNAQSLFDYQLTLPDDTLTKRAKGILGFEERFQRVHDHVQLLLRADEIPDWGKKFHGSSSLALCQRILEQYPLVIFHGDVGTGKTTTAECIANRIVAESRTEDSLLFKLSNRVRGTGKVGEMGTLLIEAFRQINVSVGKSRRAILIIDEGDSIAATRSQAHSHHEDKVGVNTLIQAIDGLRNYSGRVLTILCTNRLSVVDAGVQRRAALVEEFFRPTSEDRKALFVQDLAGVKLSNAELSELVELTGPRGKLPTWTYSDITTRLFPQALAKAFPSRALTFADLKTAAAAIKPSPIQEDI
jgi:SpoVK/Ycf46/Vps4 family AAA+-type ATPase